MTPKKASDRTVIRYSETFKRAVVEGLEQGRYRSVKEAARRPGRSAVRV